MTKRGAAAVCLALALTLTGCGSRSWLPYAREMGDMALLRTLGRDSGPGAGELTGSTGARVSGMSAQQQEALLSFQQALLNAGAEVNNALTQCQSARAKTDLRMQQIEALERAVVSTELLMQHGSTTYLEVLTAQQSLLSARLSQVSDQFDEIQGIVNLYQALGGGRDLTQEEK